MSSFLECRKGISFYMKELTFFELDERVFPNCGQLFESSFFVLLSTFSFPQRYITHTVRDAYFFIERILLADVQRFIPNGSDFRLCGKISIQTNREINIHLKQKKKKNKLKQKRKQKQFQTF